MIRRRTRNVLILALCIFALLGSILLLCIKSWRKNSTEITVEIYGETSELLSVNKPDLKPGESYYYTVILACKAEGRYLITLQFEEIKKGGLENYVNVETSCNGTVYQSGLNELLESEDGITFICELKRSPATNIKILYSMPLEVGNEAQGTELDFNVSLTAVRKG